MLTETLLYGAIVAAFFYSFLTDFLLLCIAYCFRAMPISHILTKQCLPSLPRAPGMRHRIQCGMCGHYAPLICKETRFVQI